MEGDLCALKEIVEVRRIHISEYIYIYISSTRKRQCYRENTIDLFLYPRVFELILAITAF